jgi:hypothetical protein
MVCALSGASTQIGPAASRAVPMVFRVWNIPGERVYSGLIDYLKNILRWSFRDIRTLPFRLGSGNVR